MTGTPWIVSGRCHRPIRRKHGSSPGPAQCHGCHRRAARRRGRVLRHRHRQSLGARPCRVDRADGGGTKQRPSGPVRIATLRQAEQCFLEPIRAVPARQGREDCNVEVGTAPHITCSSSTGPLGSVRIATERWSVPSGTDSSSIGPPWPVRIATPSLWPNKAASVARTAFAKLAWPPPER